MKKKSKNLFLLTSIIFLIILSLSFVSAECITIDLAKEEYMPKETLQAEIDANLSQTLTTNDIFLYREDYLLPNVFYLTKITNSKYFIWTDLPNAEGNYKLKLRGRCDNNLRFAEKEFKITNKISTLYENIPEEDFSSYSLDEHILLAMTWNYKDEINNLAQSEFLGRDDSCYDNECTTIQNSLSAIAFPNLRTVLLNKLIAYQNSIVNGNLFLNIDSTEQICSIKINEENSTNISLSSGIQNITLNLNKTTSNNEIKINLECEQEITAKLYYEYEDILYVLDEKQGTTNNFNIDNSGCWGSSMKGECEEKSTAYASFVLKYLAKNVEQKTINWLSENNDLLLTKSVYYMLTKDNETGAFIKANELFSGGWPETPGAYVTDTETTAITYFALKEEYSLTKTENRMISLFSSLRLDEKARSLFFIFSSDKLKPVITIWPGIIKTRSQDKFDIILKNEGNENITVNSIFMGSLFSTNLEPGDMKNLKITVPKLTTPNAEEIIKNFDIVYQNDYQGKNNYVVPVLIFTEQGEEQTNGTANASESEINSSQEQGIINETQNGTLQNQTTNIESSVLDRNFRFSKRTIEQTITSTEQFTIETILLNRLDQPIEDITLVSGSNFIGLVKIEPSFIETLNPDERKNITLEITPTISNLYSGTITANGKIGDQDVSTNISLSLDIQLGEIIQTCRELNGTDCSEEDEICEGNMTNASDTSMCCIGKCKKKSKGVLWPIIVIVAAIVLLIIVFLLLKRKPNKEMKDVLDEVRKKYSKKYEAPTEPKTRESNLKDL